jgi:hypothetical protein
MNETNFRMYSAVVSCGRDGNVSFYGDKVARGRAYICVEHDPERNGEHVRDDCKCVQ